MKVLIRQLKASQCITYAANNGKEACEFIEKSKLSAGSDSDTADIDVCLMVRPGLLYRSTAADGYIGR